MKSTTSFDPIENDCRGFERGSGCFLDEAPPPIGDYGLDFLVRQPARVQAHRASSRSTSRIACCASSINAKRNAESWSAGYDGIAEAAGQLSHRRCPYPSSADGPSARYSSIPPPRRNTHADTGSAGNPPIQGSGGTVPDLAQDTCRSHARSRPSR